MITTLPRRGSVDLDDAGYDGRLGTALQVQVWLDGIEQDMVITYDIDEGMIVRVAVDDQGKVLLNTKVDEVMRETVHGHVRVVRKVATVG